MYVNHLPSESPIEWEERSLRWEGEGLDRNVNGHTGERSLVRGMFSGGYLVWVMCRLTPGGAK